MYLFALKISPQYDGVKYKSKRKPYSNGKIEFILQIYLDAQNEIQCV